jgi:PAS domain-containing protein
MSTNSLENKLASADSNAPSSEQFRKLVEVISRSQHNYRELIDHLDQAVFTLSLKGEVRVANRHFAEILQVSFSGSEQEFVKTS